VGVDLDPVPLAWGERHVRSGLGPAARRVRLLQADVRGAAGPRADVVLALNFSYFTFRERSVLLDYFVQTRRHLRRDGLFIMDAFGGKESMEVLEESTRHAGFTYVWDQADFDPMSHRIRCHIHFRFPDGSALPRAFTYDWRLWTVPELLDLLAEAGFAKTDVYLEGVDDDGDGNGVYRKARRTEPCEGLVGYLVSRPA
jgi:cyclopropane fatty-acyl-phospholipid synthase-like methyltransferase